jgi:hypothetical protein
MIIESLFFDLTEAKRARGRAAYSTFYENDLQPQPIWLTAQRNEDAIEWTTDLIIIITIAAICIYRTGIFTGKSLNERK